MIQTMSLRSYFEKGHRARIFVFCLFFGFLWLFTQLFHGFVYHNIHLNFNELREMAVIWLPKIAVALFVAIPVLFCRRNWWTIMVIVLLAVWIVANILYFRANKILLTYSAIAMAGNLGGVGGSVWMFVNWKSVIFLLLALVYGALVIWLAPVNKDKPTKHTIWVSVLLLAICYSLSVVAGKANYRLHLRAGDEQVVAQKNATIQPFIGALDQSHEDAYQYVAQHSILDYFPLAFLDGLVFGPKKEAEESLTMTKTEWSLMRSLDKEVRKEPVPKRNLILICVESLESWPIEVTDQAGTYITPYLHALTTDSAVIYAPYMKSQVRHGVSSDGHMILNTGLLPLKNGAACRLLADNTYPNYAHLYKESVLVNAVAPDFWDHAAAARNYGYSKLVKPSLEQMKVDVFERVMDLSWSDAEMFRHATEEWKNMEEPKCLMALTLSSHSPFKLVPDNKQLDHPLTLPKAMRKYFTCLHYVDSCIGAFLTELEQEGQLRNTTVVITGDHTVFKEMVWLEFRSYMQRHEMAEPPEKNYVPFIVLTPDHQQAYLPEECWQADVYPTILSLIGCTDYHWKGVGVNLTDSIARENRPMTEKEAYRLSNKLLRSNYFKP